MTTTDDSAALFRPDAEHLLNLMVMLPDAKDTSFWEHVAEAEHPDRSDNGYFVSHIHAAVARLRAALNRDGDLAPMRAEDVAQYMLMFFDRDDDRLHAAIGRGLPYPAQPASRSGRRWCEDVSATAWRLYVAGRGALRRDHEAD